MKWEDNQISIRRFEEKDIQKKVEWINNPLNNEFLHYDLPLEYDKTLIWYKKNNNNQNRFDAVIEYQGIPVGLIGLLSIDMKNKKAEYYISMGEHQYKGKGIATRASKILLDYAFNEIGLEKVYLFTEKDNVIAQKLFKKIGFIQEGLLRKSLFYNGSYRDRYVYAITKELMPEIYCSNKQTPLTKLQVLHENQIYIKRDDLFPFSFGGNKARKGQLFFEEIEKNNCDCVVTYGTSSSNHCRIVANLAYSKNMPCYIISPIENYKETYNSKMIQMFNANIIQVPVEQVHDTIEQTLSNLKNEGFNPYFIEGGGHGNIGTEAIVGCYNEIKQYEIENDITFDYIFFATGTGTTQAGLVCGKLMNHDDSLIIGISIARKKPRGREVVLDSIYKYLNSIEFKYHQEEIEKATIFIDDYTGDSYGSSNEEIKKLIEYELKMHGLPLDTTYTGKAFFGMQDYIKKNEIKNKNILFIHTGGTPLFFDSIK